MYFFFIDRQVYYRSAINESYHTAHSKTSVTRKAYVCKRQGAGAPIRLLLRGALPEVCSMLKGAAGAGGLYHKSALRCALRQCRLRQRELKNKAWIAYCE